MKKSRWMATLCILGVLVMISAAYAQAAAPQATQNYFALREGVSWDTTVSEMTAIEGDPDPEYTEEEGGFQAYYYFNKPVSNYTAAQLVFVFQNGQLIMTGYNLEAMDEEDYTDLMEAISSKYGMPIEEDFRRYIDIMNALSGDPVSYEEYQDYIAETELSNWELDDGTYIIMMFERDNVYILYINEERIMGPDTMNIEGL